MVAAVAAAGVVGFGSAAVATVGPLGSSDVKDALPGAVENVKDQVSGSVGSDIVDIPSGAGDLEAALADLRSKLESQSVAITPQSADLSGARLAAAMDDAAERVRAGSAQLTEAQNEGADKLADKLETAAAQVRASSLSAPTGSAGASTDISTQDASGSASGGGSMSSDLGGGTVAGGGSLSGEQALTQVMGVLVHTQQLDQADALSGASAEDLLDRDNVDAALERVAFQVNQLVG